MSMKALYQINLPVMRERSDSERMADSTNQYRLNHNFRSVADELFLMEETVDGLEAKILERVPVPADYVSAGGECGVWRFRSWNDGTVEAWQTTETLQESMTAANGSLFASEVEVALPTTILSTVDSISVTPISETAVVASVKSINATSVFVTLLTTASALVSLKLSIHIAGRAE